MNFFLRHRLLWFTVISHRDEIELDIDFLFFLIYGSYNKFSNIINEAVSIQATMNEAR